MALDKLSNLKGRIAQSAAPAAPAAPAPVVPVPQKSTKRTASPTLSRKPFPTLKLVYFDIPGKGEPIRLALTYLGIPFEDYRVKDRAEFHSMRDSGELMFGQLHVQLKKATRANTFPPVFMFQPVRAAEALRCRAAPRASWYLARGTAAARGAWWRWWRW
mgnify:CR=1 FL=1